MTGPERPKLFVRSDQPPGTHDAQIAATRDLAPDLMVEVQHINCGDVQCRRPNGVVRVSVTWLDAEQGELQFRAFFHDEGHMICKQTLKRAQRKIDEAYLARRAQH